MEEQVLTAIPQFAFHVDGTSIGGYVTASTIDEATEILKRIHLGPVNVLKVENEITFIEGATYTLNHESIKNKIVRMGHVN